MKGVDAYKVRKGNKESGAKNLYNRLLKAITMASTVQSFNQTL